MTLPEVADYMSNCQILVTGGTGFVGLALVEKLLRTVPDIGNIYILIRSKRGQCSLDRLAELRENSIFEVLLKSGRGSDLNKLKVIEGSIDEYNLGLCQHDEETLITNVNYVFHCAATLDFEASLKTTVEVNLLGTRRVIELCKQMDVLVAFLHVSSAYTNANRTCAEEILYPAPADINQVVTLVQTLSDSQIEEYTPKLLKNHPNTYTFTKALAEHEVANSFRDIPSCIVRPSMIVGVLKDPMPGWTNSKNGPQGFIMGAAMGVVRRLPVAKTLVYDYIPVDKVVNTMIMGAIYVCNKREELSETPIFHCTTSTCNPFKWELVENTITGLLQKNALVKAVWYPHLKLLPSVWHYRMSAPIFHMIPAYFFDTLARITGGRPKLVKLHTSINQSLERLEPFIFQEWFFDNTKQMQLHKEIAPVDQELFGLDVSSLKWERFFEDMSMGVRLYLHKEKESALPRAIKKNKVLMVLNLTVQITLFALIWLIIKYLFGLPGLQAALVLPFFYVLYNML